MHMNSSRNMFVARCSAIFLVVAALCGNGVAWTAEYALNIDAKPIVLPCGLKFGEVYNGEAKPVRSSYVNGIELKRYEAANMNWSSKAESSYLLSGRDSFDVCDHEM